MYDNASEPLDPDPREKARRETAPEKVAADINASPADIRVASSIKEQLVLIKVGDESAGKIVGLPPANAVALAELLIKHARRVSTEPLIVNIS